MENKKEISFFTNLVDTKTQEVFSHLEKSFSKINIGRANPQILAAIKVDYYGTLTPINEVATITVPSALQLLIRPYETNLVKEIASAIVAHKLEVQVQKEANQVRLIFPELTTDKRKELVKSLKKYEEEAKVKVRLIRQDVNKIIKNEELSEDEKKDYLDKIQKQVDKIIEKIEKILSEKSASLLNF